MQRLRLPSFCDADSGHCSALRINYINGQAILSVNSPAEPLMCTVASRFMEAQIQWRRVKSFRRKSMTKSVQELLETVIVPDFRRSLMSPFSTVGSSNRAMYLIDQFLLLRAGTSKKHIIEDPVGSSVMTSVGFAEFYKLFKLVAEFIGPLPSQAFYRDKKRLERFILFGFDMLSVLGLPNTRETHFVLKANRELLRREARQPSNFFRNVIPTEFIGVESSGDIYNQPHKMLQLARLITET